MDSQDEVNLDLRLRDSDDKSVSEPVSATMSRGCELNQEISVEPGKLPHKSMAAEAQIGDTEANSIQDLDTSTAVAKLMPSKSEMANLDLAPAFNVPTTNTTGPILAPQLQMLHNGNVNIICNSNISGSQLNMITAPSNNANGPQDPVDSNQEIELPNHCSTLFAEACLRCARCLDKENRLDELKLLLRCWSSNDIPGTFFPDAQTAKSVVQLFNKGIENHVWHWIDFQNLIRLIDLVECEQAKTILSRYEKQLMQFCEKELHDLLPYRESQTPPTVTKWMDVKWKGDKKKFKVGKLYRCKEFLVDHLKIPSSDFVFYELFPGCVTLRWVVLTESASATIEAHVQSCTKSTYFLDAEVEIKLIRPMNPPQKNVPYSGEYLFFGDKEYVFSQQVPEYAQCIICLGILQNAVVTNCCHSAFCLDCCEKANKAKNKCPICRCEGFQYARNEYIDKQIVGNVLAECCRCKWIGYLWNALSLEYHPCLSKEELQEVAAEATESDNEERQEEAVAMPSALPQSACIEGQEEVEEKDNLVSEKGPLVDMIQTLLNQLRALQASLNEEAMSTSGVHLTSAAPETLCDAVDEFLVLLQDMEENLLAAEGSIVSGNERRLPVADDDANKTQQCESGQSAKNQVGATDTAVAPRSGVTTLGTDTQESEIKSTCAEEAINLQGLGVDITPHKPPPQHVQSPEQSAAQKRLVREAEHITHWAARAGHVSLLEQLLTATGIDPDHTLLYAQESLLYIACRFGYPEMAQMLISLGASVVLQSGNGRSPMHGAAYSGSLPCLELLLQKDAGVSVSDLSGDTPLHTAAQQGHAAFAEKLVHLSHTSVNKKNVNGQTPLHCASQGGNCEVIEILLKANAILDALDDEGFTPLHIAVTAGNADAAKVLLDRKADPNIASTMFGLTPLHSAAEQAEGLQLIQLLHAAGANVAACDQKGRSALHHAIKSNNLKVVQTVAEIGCPIDDATQETPGLPAAGAEEPYRWARLEDGRLPKVDHRGRLLPDEDDVQNSGSTPLHFAILAQKVEFVRFLLSKGADVHKTTSTGCAAIHLAVQSGDASLVKEIISAGSSTDLMTHSGLSPLHLAAQWGHKNAATELINAGCDKEKLTVGKQKSKAMTALLIAAMKHQSEMVRTIAKAGCNVQATTADGRNAIHLAVSAALHTNHEPCHYCGRIHPGQYRTSFAQAHWMHNHTDREAYETITVLVQLGCDINAMDVDGLSPLDLAQKGYRYNTREEDLYSGWYQYQHQHYSSHLVAILRRLGARTGYEVRQKAALSQTFHHATESAENIELKLASKPKPVGVTNRKKRRQRVWGKVGARVPSSYQLSHLVVPRVSRLWREIGSSLDIAPDRLDEADEDCIGDSLECCMKVFNFWLHGEGKGPKTWDTVFDVLSEIGYTGLAESVRRQL